MRLKSDLTLLTVAMIWGSGFVAQRAATRYLNAFYFNSSRFLIAALLLLLLIRFRWTLPRHHWWKVGLTGLLVFGGAGLQQAGMSTTKIGNASFITGLYVVLVPIILALFARHKIAWLTWFSAFLAVFGIGLLSLTSSFKLSPGDSLELGGAFLWAAHVILVGRFSRQMDVLQLSIGQFVVGGMLNLIVALVLTPYGALGFPMAWQVVLYSAVFSTAIGFTLQVVGQKTAKAADAAIILSLEAVFGAFFGYLILHETLTVQQIIGCTLMLAAMILSQLRGGLLEEENQPVHVEAGTAN